MKLNSAGLLAALAAGAAIFTGSANAASASYPSGNPTRISQRGAAFIKQEEGFQPRAYKDGVSPVGIQLYSIGYGHQITGSDGLSKNSVIDAATADRLFDADVASREKAIIKNVRVPLTQGQFDALASLTYNIGIGAFQGSTLLRKLNAKDYAGARAEFAVWNKSAGKVHPVLVGRRQREANMFATG